MFGPRLQKSCGVLNKKSLWCFVSPKTNWKSKTNGKSLPKQTESRKRVGKFLEVRWPPSNLETWTSSTALQTPLKLCPRTRTLFFSFQSFFFYRKQWVTFRCAISTLILALSVLVKIVLCVMGKFTNTAMTVVKRVDSVQFCPSDAHLFFSCSPRDASLFDVLFRPWY